jgi:hypothetical protein
MKTKTRQSRRRVQLKMMFGQAYYIDWISELEVALAKRPKTLCIELIGQGEVPADCALLIRSILMKRSEKTRVVTDARSSLQGGSVLVWLLGDERIIREDARLYLRRVDLPDEEEESAPLQNSETKYRDSFSEIDPDDYDYARVLQVINEFLPMKELAGRPIRVSVLKEFGLIENEKVDDQLAIAFGRIKERLEQPRTSKPKELMKEASK